MRTHQNKPTSISIREDAVALLKALRQVNSPCEAGRFIDLILAPAAQIKGSEAFRGFSRTDLSILLNCLLEKGLIESASGLPNHLLISERGRAFLNFPARLRVNINDLFEAENDRWLMEELREIRLSLSTAEEKPAYCVFRDYTLLRIVIRKPTTVATLSELAGFGAFQVNQYGHAVIQAVKRARELKKEVWQDQLRKRAWWPSFQAVKALFETGLQIDEIANKRHMQPASVQQILEQLHYAGEINLIPWIERNIDRRELQSGVDYFRAVTNPRLKDAYERLGLEYRTLRLCHLYVSGVASYEEELKNAS